jgi:hypothetical protein
MTFALLQGPATETEDAMDPKLTILFMLITVVVVLSHLTDENLTRMRQQFVARRWRKFVRIPRKI